APRAAAPCGLAVAPAGWPQLVVLVGGCCPCKWLPLVGGMAAAGRPLAGGQAMPGCPSSSLPSLRKCSKNA
ncbi:hypothetical protein BHM03_00058205, partial [Ensete ventricosum]